ncbi:Sedlin [Aspergillus coremiiformis]|uniref:Sedlin n=1 Tax=Aspergillus coremiiformis TaxID=138285 RepID=A0A5N6YUM1_9EURO|nr:Sedlin [Aspergillus coremiiformis]
MSGPKIACIGIIGKADNPLHISLFPPYLSSTIEFSFLLNSCLDIFEIQQKQTSVDQDLGLLHAIDERLAAYGWLTTTGVKLLVIIDLIGQSTPNDTENQKGSGRTGLKNPDLKPVFRALQTAYIRLLQNPFYSPDDHVPTVRTAPPTLGSLQIADHKFIAKVKHLGDTWAPGAPVA